MKPIARPSTTPKFASPTPIMLNPEPRIWADFTRDKILMDEPHTSNPRFNRIRCWEFAAREDVKKIRALGIA
jgi:5'(3')-deoxyribonucleotidase